MSRRMPARWRSSRSSASFARPRRPAAARRRRARLRSLPALARELREGGDRLGGRRGPGRTRGGARLRARGRPAAKRSRRCRPRGRRCRSSRSPRRTVSLPYVLATDIVRVRRAPAFRSTRSATRSRAARRGRARRSRPGCRRSARGPQRPDPLVLAHERRHRRCRVHPRRRHAGADAEPDAARLFASRSPTARRSTASARSSCSAWSGSGSACARLRASCSISSRSPAGPSRARSPMTGTKAIGEAAVRYFEAAGVNAASFARQTSLSRPSGPGPTISPSTGGDAPHGPDRIPGSIRALLIEEADAWFEYLEAMRGQSALRYVEVEPWAWARLSQRLRAIRTRRSKLRPAAEAA